MRYVTFIPQLYLDYAEGIIVQRGLRYTAEGGQVHFYPLVFQAEGVLSLPVSVRPFVCLSVCKLYLFCRITCHRFEMESPNLHQICILGFCQLVLKTMLYWPWPSRSFGHFDAEFQETAFKIALVYWSRPVKGCYMSQRAPVKCYKVYGDILKCTALMVD